MKPHHVGILQKVRSEGYREGWAQASQIAHDDAYYRGWEDAEAIHRLDARWWFISGAAVMAALVTLVWRLTA